MRVVPVVVLLLSAHPLPPPAAWDAAPRTTEYPWMSVAAWRQLHDGHVARSKTGGVDVVFLGDSITEGWGAAGAATWAARYEPLDAVNYGISCDTTREVLYRVDHGIFDGIAPKVVVVLIGTNNFGHTADTPAEVAHGVAAVVRAVRRKAPGARVLLLGIFPRDHDPGTAMRAKIAATNDRLAMLADGDAVVFRDIGPAFLAADGTLPADVMPDALHLSAEGYARWAEAIDEPLKALRK